MFDEIKKKFGLVVVEKDLLHEIWGSPYQLEDDGKQRTQNQNQNQTIDSGIRQKRLTWVLSLFLEPLGRPRLPLPWAEDFVGAALASATGRITCSTEMLQAGVVEFKGQAS